MKQPYIRLFFAGLGTILVLPAIHYVLLWIGFTMIASYITLSAAIVQAVAYSGVFILFGMTLLPGRVPLVTRLARLSRGELPPELILYTRRVTIAWCCFALGELATSGMLFVFAPHAWTIFITTMNLPLLAAMAVGEYVYRLIRYRHLRHETPAQMVQLMKQVRNVF